jgi:hypothetical protein
VQPQGKLLVPLKEMAMILKNKNISVGGALIAGLMWTSNGLAVQSDQMAPPKVNTVDRFGVNVATGQINLSVDTVSIGGEMGLAHSVSGYTNNFSMKGNYGFMDKYAGSASRVSIYSWEAGMDYFQYKGKGYQYFKVMRVFGPVGSEDFVVLEDGELRPTDTIGNGVVTYEAMGDTRHTLEVVKSSDPDGDRYSGLLRWTTPDGTASYYSASPNPIAHRSLIAIAYPSGFTIRINGLGSVTTNTGFQLRYERPVVSTGLSPEKLAIRSSLPQSAQIRSVNPELWSYANPSYIIGINNAVEYCSPVAARDVCDLEEDWPRATFTWPGGMPQAIYLGKNVVTIENATGGVTELHYEAHDASLLDLNKPNGTAQENLRGIIWSPRLVGVKSAASEVIDRTYTYENIGSWSTLSSPQGLQIFQYWTMGSEAGRVVRASGPEGTASYQLQSNLAYRGSGSWAGDVTVSTTLRSGMLGALESASVHKEGWYRFEPSFRNFVESHYPVSGPTRTFEYTRGNLTKIIFEQNEPNATTVEANYPSSCTIATRKICNKPIWVKDARGNQTDYQYHAPSGQVAVVTNPPDNDGRRAQTHYKYEQKYAWYKKNGSSIERADVPIWMLVEQCQTGNASASGCGTSADDVVTTYDYGPDDGSKANNLLLRSKTVTADKISRTTCYQYDIYGNQIGETKPKAGFGPSTCP